MCRLLCVEHVQEGNRPVLYLVSASWTPACFCAYNHDAWAKHLHDRQSTSMHEPGSDVPQVFEYLTTDLKKFMDAIGKGPKSPPMPRLQIKVRGSRF